MKEQFKPILLFSKIFVKSRKVYKEKKAREKTKN